MIIEDIINRTGKELSPYRGSLVNHVPMVQWAIYRLSGETKYVEEFNAKYIEKAKVDRVKKEYEDVNSLKEALGKRELYEGTVDFLNKELSAKDINELTRYILNKYPLGMSSGVFHTLIRVAYGVEGYREKDKLKEELIRGLSYYITAYREADLFKRKVLSKDIIGEIRTLSRMEYIKEILESYDSLGKRMRGLYNDGRYLEDGFIIEGNEEEKIRGLLDLLIPLFCKRNNIVLLHCITGLHALIILKECFEDFEKAIDIFTTCVITHIIASEFVDYPEMKEASTSFSWNYIIQKTLKSNDIHDIKLTYSALSLDRLYNIEQLKDVSIKRIKHA